MNKKKRCKTCLKIPERGGSHYRAGVLLCDNCLPIVVKFKSSLDKKLNYEKNHTLEETIYADGYRAGLEYAISLL